MKLKKGISLLLVLALSLMSFAFTVSADAATVNVAIVADVDTSALEVGDTFVANINLTDISANALYSVALGVTFNPEVLQVVDQNGTPAPDDASAVGFISCSDIDSFFAYVPNQVYNVDNTTGKATYSIAPNTTNISNVLSVESGEYTAVGIRFKVVGTGLTELAFNMEDVQVWCSAEDEAAVTDKTEDIRIGLPVITAVEDPADAVNVDVDTAKEDVIAEELPATVVATFDDESKEAVAVTWDCDDYDAEVPGEYTFIGTIEGTDLTASVTVTVKPVAITAATAVETIKVPNGESKEKILSLLPETVEVTLANGKKDTVSVGWVIADGTGENTQDTEKTVQIEGVLDAGTKYTNEGDAVKASATLEISAAVLVPTDGTVETVVEDKEVTYGEATKEDVIASLPETVEIAVEGVGIVVSSIDWVCDDYDAAKAGDYTFIGTIKPVTNVTLNSETIKVIVTVKENEVIEILTSLGNKVIDADDTLKLVDLFGADVDVKYQDGTTGIETIVWNDESKALTAEKAGTYTLIGYVGTYKVEVQVTVNENNDSEEEFYNDVVILLNNRMINGTTQNMFTSQIYVLDTNVDYVEWSSNKEGVAYVTTDGKLVGRNPGKARITAKAEDGSQGSFDVIVRLNPGTIVSVGEATSGDEIVIPFTDLADYSWATRMICELASNGVVSGKTATLYAPGDNVTRAEYASLLVRALKLSANGAGKEFTDVAQGEWYYNAVQTASALGIVSGYEDGSFRPNNSITREEMAVMTLRAAEAAGRSLPAKTSVSFSDADQISGYARDAVNKLAAAQIINGMGDGTFAPQQTANRAQAAVIIYQLCEL